MSPSIGEESLAYHRMHRPGKIEVRPTKPVETQHDLALAYTPGVAAVCRAIAADPESAYEFTAKANLVGVISNGTAVLGLGDIGALAGKPVMEGKAVLFKRLADIDAFDIEVDEKDPEAFIRIVKAIAPTFGAINLEDISAPSCFEIERRLIDELDIPVMHDDQHGTAIIAGAALLNALPLVGKKLEDVRIVFSGAGAAAIGCLRLWHSLGVAKEQIILCDSRSVVHEGREEGMSPEKREFAARTDARTLEEAMRNADVFVGLSVAGTVTPAMLEGMAPNPIVFTLANPDPEIPYDLARATRPDAILATGRSDYPNQVNNVLGYPFIFRGALEARAKKITLAMKLAAVRALAELAKEPVPQDVLDAYGLTALAYGPDYLIPKPLDSRLREKIAGAVAAAAREGRD